MQIPIIDFSDYDPEKPKSISAIAQQVSSALTDIGFMAVINIGIDAEDVKQAFETSHAFFALSPQQKQQCAYTNANDNFGYQALLAEHLDPSHPADLKETFTMRNPAKYADTDSRWPSVEFKQTSLAFYKQCVASANKVLTVFADALQVPPQFFVDCFSGQNVSLRFLHYPSTGPQVTAKQLGAGAHTDYGIITLLFQDNVGGLEVRDKQGDWQAVDYVENAIIINTGDLMERWTNGTYKSTEHRVQPKIGQRDRYSIALFMDPDSNTKVTVLESCTSANNPARFPPISAGEHILEKLRATHAGY